MKKIVSLLLVLCMVLALVACSQQPATDTPADTAEPVAEEPAKETATEEPVVDEAAGFPEREIRIIVPYDAGGASDMTSRIIATGLEEALGATVLVENRSGGTGSVGMTYARESASDGYTICYIPVELVMQKALEISDLVPDDFMFIGRLTEVPSALTIKADDDRFGTVEEFVAYALAHPGEVTIGNSGTGSIWHVAATLLEEKTGAQFNHVPYDGAAGAVTSLMGGHIDAVTVNPGEVLAGVEAGKLKCLALMTEERDTVSFAEIPTMRECGIDIVFGGWGALAVPAGTPQAVVDKLSAALEKAAATTEFKDFIAQRGMIVHYSNAADTTKFIYEQFDVFNELLTSMEID